MKLNFLMIYVECSNLPVCLLIFIYEYGNFCTDISIHFLISFVGFSLKKIATYKMQEIQHLYSSLTYTVFPTVNYQLYWTEPICLDHTHNIYTPIIAKTHFQRMMKIIMQYFNSFCLEENCWNNSEKLQCKNFGNSNNFYNWNGKTRTIQDL